MRGSGLLNQRRERYRKTRDEVIAHYGGKCYCCGIRQREFLGIDHSLVETDSNFRSGSRLIIWLKQNNFPAGFRVLCHNCNSSLGFYGYCPCIGKETSEEARYKQPDHQTGH